MQTPQEKLRAFFPDAQIIPYEIPEQGSLVAMPDRRAGEWCELSQVYPPGTSEEVMWQNALEQFVERCRILLEGEAE